MSWFVSFQNFLQIHGRLSFLTNDSPSFGDPSRIARFIEDQADMTWLLKLTISSIGEPI